uniref:Uncharacterized protein n=1 Tax=Magallana gigas TaxID=29159 RepID=K1QVG7_MAGGI
MSSFYGSDCKDPPKCTNGGFVNHKCECYCPRGYKGKTCETVISDGDCGGMLDVPPGKDVFVVSPGYPAPYPLGKICRWGVKRDKQKATQTDHRIHSSGLWPAELKPTGVMRN